MPDSDLLLTSALGIATVVMAVVALLQKNLIRSVAAYALSSIALACLFFLMASPYAGALELMVGGGLVAVLFLVALVLSGGEEEVSA